MNPIQYKDRFSHDVAHKHLFCKGTVKALSSTYRNDPKFLDRYAWANSADPDQTAPRGAVCSRSSLIRVCTVCLSICIIWTHCSMVEPHSSNFRVITTNYLGVRIFRKFTALSFFALFQLDEWCLSCTKM